MAGIAPPPAPDAQQLALFAAGEHPVVKELQDLDPETLTPIEALTRLAELKKRAEDR